jgi:predicted acyltransferase
VEPSAVAPPAEGPRRALALDALRGLFLLLMTFGFSIADGVYPAWMYHRQEPPPAHAFAEIAGLTWRDLAYPAFLFTMAAAIPITFGRRIARGAGLAEIARASARRWSLLFVFALIVAHSSGYWIGEYSALSQALSLAGFALLCLLFTRPPARLDPRLFRGLRLLGWGAALAFLALGPHLYGKRFDLGRRDEILAELAFASLVSIWVWYATRRDRPLRAALLAAAVALALGASAEGWVANLWWGSPVPAVFEVAHLELLCVLIPGIFAGERLAEWLGTTPLPAPAHWSRTRVQALVASCALVSPLLVLGLYSREVFATALASFALGALVLWLVRAPGSEAERVLRDLIRAGVLWLVLGMLLEPFQGGIKKVPGTLSYYFALAGNTALLLAALFALAELLGVRRGLATLVEIGQNPLLAYVIFTLFLDPLLDLLPGMSGFLRGSPAELLVRSLLSVLLVAGLVRELTRRGLFWRA